jgi:hypothetical protein
MFYNDKVGNLDANLMGCFELSFIMADVGIIYKFRGLF